MQLDTPGVLGAKNLGLELFPLVLGREVHQGRLTQEEDGWDCAFVSLGGERLMQRHEQGEV